MQNEQKVRNEQEFQSLEEIERLRRRMALLFTVLSRISVLFPLRFCPNPTIIR